MQVELYKSRGDTVFAEIDTDATRVIFECSCGQWNCPHIEECMKERADSVLFKQLKETWDWFYWIRVPILFNPEVYYFVIVKHVRENDFIIVKCDLNYWKFHLGHNRIQKSISLDSILSSDLKFEEQLDHLKLLTLLTEGDGCADITSSLFDTFNSFHVEHKPKYKCRSNLHNFHHEEILQFDLKSKKFRGEVMARLFFTDICTSCAIEIAKPMEDVVPNMDSF